MNNMKLQEFEDYVNKAIDVLKKEVNLDNFVNDWIKNSKSKIVAPLAFRKGLEKPTIDTGIDELCYLASLLKRKDVIEQLEVIRVWFKIIKNTLKEYLSIVDLNELSED